MSSGETSEPTPDSAVLAEDLADLKATVESLAAQLEDTNRLAENLRDGAAGQAAEGSGDGGTADDAAKDGDGKKGKKDKPQIPPLILRLDGETYDKELALLAQWVQYVLVEQYLTEVSSNAPWCPRWWEHPQAVARLHALWLAWQELTTPEAGGYTGPSVWHRDHLDQCIAQLRAPDGPFAACMTKPDRVQHTLLPQPPIDPFPGTG